MPAGVSARGAGRAGGGHRTGGARRRTLGAGHSFLTLNLEPQILPYLQVLAPVVLDALVADIALEAPGGARTALVIDGPERFCANEPARPLGGALLTWRLFAARGWKVLCCLVTTVCLTECAGC